MPDFYYLPPDVRIASTKAYQEGKVTIRILNSFYFWETGFSISRMVIFVKLVCYLSGARHVRVCLCFRNKQNLNLGKNNNLTYFFCYQNRNNLFHGFSYVCVSFMFLYDIYLCLFHLFLAPIF